MTNYELVLFVAIGSVAAGFLGALTGLGGGVVLVPMLTLLFGIDLRYAIGASLVPVIATTAGAIGGAYLAVWLNPSLIAVVFGVVLLYSAWQAMFSGATPILRIRRSLGDILATL